MTWLNLIFVAVAAFATGDATHVDAGQALTETAAGKAVFLDVREDGEVAQGSMKGALHFPTSKIGSEEWNKFMQGLDKKKPVYVYCARGRRAEKAATLLRENGFNAKNAGGYEALKTQGTTKAK